MFWSPTPSSGFTGLIDSENRSVKKELDYTDSSTTTALPKKSS